MTWSSSRRQKKIFVEGIIGAQLSPILWALGITVVSRLNMAWVYSYWAVSVVLCLPSNLMVRPAFRSAYWNYFIRVYLMGATMMLGHFWAMIAGASTAFGDKVHPALFGLLFICVYAGIYADCWFWLEREFKPTLKERLRSFDFKAGTYNLLSGSLGNARAVAVPMTRSISLRAVYKTVVRFPAIGALAMNGTLGIYVGRTHERAREALVFICAALMVQLLIYAHAMLTHSMVQLAKLERQHGIKFRPVFGEP